MRNTGPASFGARLANHPPMQEEGAWFFNVQEAPAGEAEPDQAETDDTAGKIQIGPLDT